MIEVKSQYEANGKFLSECPNLPTGPVNLLKAAKLAQQIANTRNGAAGETWRVVVKVDGKVLHDWPTNLQEAREAIAM